jgi:hypothetical protein
MDEHDVNEEELILDFGVSRSSASPGTIWDSKLVSRLLKYAVRRTNSFRAR